MGGGGGGGIGETDVDGKELVTIKAPFESVHHTELMVSWQNTPARNRAPSGD